jgi:murein DD-endopeptidase MepM/ murein hydrolase activator NlpD
MNLGSSGVASIIVAVVACFSVGAAAGWWLNGALSRDEPGAGVTERAASPPLASASKGEAERPAATTGEASERGTASMKASGTAELRERHLRLPIDGAEVAAMRGDFEEPRAGGARSHEAVDILVPRHTPIKAVENGTIAKLFRSQAGGITVYQFDPTGRYCYYYAHLERYADGLREGKQVAAGEVIGFVGTSGNAPKDTPHLHFAVFELGEGKRWWEGRPIDPYLIYKDPS